MRSNLLIFISSINTGMKFDLSVFRRCMFIAAKLPGLNMSKLLINHDFRSITISWVYTEWSEIEKKENKKKKKPCLWKRSEKNGETR